MRLEERLERKRRGVAMLRAGTAGKAVAEALGVDAATVSRWKKDLAAEWSQEPKEPKEATEAPAGESSPETLPEALEAAQEPTAPPEAAPQAHSTMAPEEARAPRGRRAKERRMSAAFYLPVAMVARLDALAEAEGVAVSVVVERLLRKALGD